MMRRVASGSASPGEFRMLRTARLPKARCHWDAGGDEKTLRVRAESGKAELPALRENCTEKVPAIEWRRKASAQRDGAGAAKRVARNGDAGGGYGRHSPCAPVTRPSVMRTL